MKELNFSNCDYSFHNPSNDILYDFLNLEDNDCFEFENRSLNNSQHSDNLVNQPMYKKYNQFNKTSNVNESLSLSYGGKVIESMNRPMSNTLSMGVDMNFSNTNYSKNFDHPKLASNIETVEKTIMSKEDTLLDSIANSKSGDTLTHVNESGSGKKKKITKKYKYIRRNCDMGIDTRADPDLKPSASNFIRTRGKPIKNSKKKLIKYKISGSQESTKYSDDYKDSSKRSKNSRDLSDKEGSKKSGLFNMTVSEILKNSANGSENLLLTFFTMKIANESQYKDSSDALYALDRTTRMIEHLREATKKPIKI